MMIADFQLGTSCWVGHFATVTDLINKEKLLLEYQLVEREERLRHLETQYQALEAQVKQVRSHEGSN